MEAIRQAEVKSILSGFPQIDKLMTKLLPSGLFNRSHGEWKARIRQNAVRSIRLSSNSNDRKLLQDASKILTVS